MTQFMMARPPPSSRGAGERRAPGSRGVGGVSRRRVVLVPEAVAEDGDLVVQGSLVVAEREVVAVSTITMTREPRRISLKLMEEDDEEIQSLLPSEQQWSREREKLIPLLVPQNNPLTKSKGGGPHPHSSPALSCDILMSHVRQMVGQVQGPSVIKAAMAWHCLDVLLQNSINTQIYVTLKAIRDELHEALFYLHDPGVQVTPAATHAYGAQLVSSNPFMKHLFYFEMYNRAKKAANLFGGKYASMKSSSEGRQAIIKKSIQESLRRMQHLILTLWRKYARKKVQKRKLKHHIDMWSGKNLMNVRLQAAFMRWRYTVEQTRSMTLMERQSMMQFQLQNVKNQFQLQCFKSDKFLRTIEELRVELAVGRAERDEALRETVLLNEKIEQQNEMKTQEMNEKLTLMGAEIKKWKHLAGQLTEKIAILSQFEVDDRPTLLELVDPEGQPSEEGPKSPKKKDKKKPSKKMADMRPVEQILLRWINSVLQKHPELSGSRGEIQNFTTDLEDGAVIVILCHVVAPAIMPIALLQEPNIKTRIERLCTAAKELELIFSPEAHHILDGQCDLIVLFLASLFKAVIDQEFPATAGKKNGLGSTIAALPDADQEIDALTLHLFLADCNSDRIHLEARKNEIENTFQEWNTMRSDVKNYQGLVLRNRMMEQPLFIVDVKEFYKYTKLPKTRLKDLQWKYNSCPASFKASPGDWLSWDNQVEETRKFLRTSYPDMRRIFQFYAQPQGSKRYISSTEFWQFCTDARVVDKFMMKSHVERIFSLVNRTGDDDDDGDYEGRATVKGDELEDNPMTELVPSEFVEAVVRIGDGKYVEMMLHDKVKAIFTENILAFTCRGGAQELRRNVNSALTQAVLKRFNKDLGRIYKFYATLLAEQTKSKVKKEGAASKMVINLQEFIGMLNEAEIMSSVLTDAHVRSVFHSVQIDSSTEPMGDMYEMSYVEFVAVLPCIACFHVPSPFVPFEKKVEVIIVKLIEGVRAKLKAGGVILGETKAPLGFI